LNKNKTIKVFDTTLRDGEQGIGHLMTIDQKMSILKSLDVLGLDRIELGFPAASDYDAQWCYQSSTVALKTKVCVFSRPTIEDINKTLLAMRGFDRFQVQLLALGSELHLLHKRGITLDQASNELKQAIQHLKHHGVTDISVIYEDATRGSKSFLKGMIGVAVDEGAHTVTMADTVGYAIPEQIFDLIKWVRVMVGSKIQLAIHAHNDLGLATANTLAAIRADADIIQTTLGGIGERAGNCALEEIAAILHYKFLDYHACLSVDLQELVSACDALFKRLQRDIPSNKPIVGPHVFTTAAGLHQNGILKKSEIYEYVQAQHFGRKRKFMFNRLSSPSVLKNLIFGHMQNAYPPIDVFYKTIIADNQSYEFEQIQALYDRFMQKGANDEKID